MKKTKQKVSFKVALGILSPYLKRHTLSFIFVFLLAAISVVGTIFIPKLIGNAIDFIIGAGQVDMDMVMYYLGLVLICLFLASLASYIMNLLNNKIAFAIVRDLRNDAISNLEHLPLSYLDTHPTGDLVSRVITDADAIADGLLMGFTQLFTGVLTIVVTLVFFISLNPFLALFVVVLTPISLFVAKFIAGANYKHFQKQSEIRGKQTSFIDEMISGQKTVQAFSHERENQVKFDEINDELHKASLNATFFSSIVNPSTRVINNLIYAVVALVGAVLILKPGFFFGLTFTSFTVGSLFSCLSYANQYTKPFNEISGVVTELQNAFVCTKRLWDFASAEREVEDTENAIDPSKLTGKIDFENVKFAYVPGQKLIENFSLHVEPGMKIAIVGPTGCGKTTLINLIMRFYDINSGEITFDENAIKSIKRNSLRKQIGMVLQETWIRYGTVKENLTLGNPDATDEEIIAAAKKCHADSFIRRLPNGYDTVLRGEGSLSAGQKQLLCIARVMITNPNILILDEATSNIDTRTEQKVQGAFRTLMEGKTTFVVAHRLSTIMNSDLILVMKDGNVIEQGSHAELISMNGFYSTLYNSQFDTGN